MLFVWGCRHSLIWVQRYSGPFSLLSTSILLLVLNAAQTRHVFCDPTKSQFDNESFSQSLQHWGLDTFSSYFVHPHVCKMLFWKFFCGHKASPTSCIATTLSLWLKLSLNGQLQSWMSGLGWLRHCLIWTGSTMVSWIDEWRIWMILMLKARLQGIRLQASRNGGFQMVVADSCSSSSNINKRSISKSWYLEEKKEEVRSFTWGQEGQGDLGVRNHRLEAPVQRPTAIAGLST